MTASRSTYRLAVASLASALAVALAACGDTSALRTGADVGVQPVLVEPVRSIVPTVNIAPAQGWKLGSAPKGAEGTTVNAFATGLIHPRWLHVLPNGDVLVAETNAPARPQDGEGIKGWVMGLVMKRAGAAVPSPNRITLLRDADGDGIAEVRHVFMEGLNSPFGMLLIGDKLYVANTDAVVAVPYQTGQTRIDATPVVVTALPAGSINHHWTKNIIANADGSRLYATVGSNSNVAENGIEAEQGRAAIWEIDLPSGQKRLYASGLRNPNGMAWGPEGKTLWTVVNERDELGSDLVPDYLTTVQRDTFYGWPYSYYGAHVDSRVDPPQPGLVAKAVVPDFALGSHVAPLGLASSRGGKLPAPFAEGMFVGLHGSWNRKPLSGYKVVFVPFQGARPQGKPINVLTGFVTADGDALGRPVGVAIDGRGALLVADDVGNVIWRVAAAAP
ncbi:MAG: sorbosone dehydrogenase family protein [Rubrivivax sp.]